MTFPITIQSINFLPFKFKFQFNFQWGVANSIQIQTLRLNPPPPTRVFWHCLHVYLVFLIYFKTKCKFMSQHHFWASRNGGIILQCNKDSLRNVAWNSPCFLPSQTCNHFFQHVRQIKSSQRLMISITGLCPTKNALPFLYINCLIDDRVWFNLHVLLWNQFLVQTCMAEFMQYCHLPLHLLLQLTEWKWSS